MSDIGVFYVGGSGGFFAFHLLMLSKQLNAAFEGDKQFDTIFQNQWNIKQMSDWKFSETWPDYRKTLQQFNDNRLFLCCNPLDDPYDGIRLDDFNGTKIVIYCDAYTHVDLAVKKKAYWFRDVNLKEPAAELAVRLKCDAATINGVKVVQNCVPLIARSDVIVFSLNDLIKSSGKCLYNALPQLTYPGSCVEFTKHYLSLYPKYIQDKLVSINTDYALTRIPNP